MKPLPPAGATALDSADTRAAWSSYWSRGAPHSCVGSYGERYGGAVARHWCAIFGALEPAARVLDVATGNGALPRLLFEECSVAGVQCDAVDIAAIAPSWVTGLDAGKRARLRFHTGVDAAALPFADHAFDLVVSHYGLEYTDLASTLPEITRACAPAGRVAFVMHHAQGRPARLARAEVDHLQWLLRAEGVVAAGAALVGPMALAAQPGGRERLQNDAGALAARQGFNGLLAELAQRGRGEGADVLFEVRDAVMAVLSRAGRDGAAAAGTAMAALARDYQAALLRLQDLCSHTLDEQAATALRDRLRAGLDAPVSLGELHDQGHLMGWTIESTRSR